MKKLLFIMFMVIGSAAKSQRVTDTLLIKIDTATYKKVMNLIRENIDSRSESGKLLLVNILIPFSNYTFLQPADKPKEIIKKVDMTLKQLEDIVRPNFIWDNNSVHKDMLTIPSNWRTIEKYSAHNDLIGLITFIGCAYVLGFDEQEVYKHVDIKRTKWIGLLGKFKAALMEYQAEQLNNILELDFGEPSVNKLIIRKSNMVLNRVKLERLCTDKYTELVDFGF